MQRREQALSEIDALRLDWPEFRGRAYAPAVVAQGRFVWTSGLNALSADGTVEQPDDIVAQARAIFRKLGSILARCGSSPQQVVKTVDYITTTVGYRQTAEVRREFFGDYRPAATGVIVDGLFGSGVLIEIEAVAVTDRNRFPIVE